MTGYCAPLAGAYCCGIGGAQHLHRLEGVAASGVDNVRPSGAIQRLESIGLRSRGANGEFLQRVHCNDRAWPLENARHLRRQRHRLERYGSTWCGGFARARHRQIAIQPAIGGALAVGRATFHVVLRIEVRARAARTAHRDDRRQQPAIIEWLERPERRMQPELAIQFQRAGDTGGERRSRDRDVRPQPVVRRIAMRHDDIQRIRRAALEDADQHLPLGGFRQWHAEGRPAQKRWIQAHRHQRHRPRSHEDTSIHCCSFE